MSMQILNNSAVLLNFTLKLADGSVAESTQAHMENRRYFVLVMKAYRLL